MTNLGISDLTDSLGLRTQIVQVLYVMGCSSDILDAADLHTEASGDSYLITISEIDFSAVTSDKLRVILGAAKASGVETIVLTP